MSAHIRLCNTQVDFALCSLLPLPRTCLLMMSTSIKHSFKLTCSKRKRLKVMSTSHLLQAMLRMKNVSIAFAHRYTVPAPAVRHGTKPCQLLWNSKASGQSASKNLRGANTMHTEKSHGKQSHWQLLHYQSHSVTLACVDRDSYQSRLVLTY